MDKKIIITAMFIIIFCLGLSGQDAQAILGLVDEHSSGSKAPRDMEMKMTMKIHKGASVKARELKVWAKNNSGRDDWSVLKFTSPADVKNIGLLVLAEDQMYLYLPEFRRIRRIASSTKKESFQGSDFSYDDLDTTEFSRFYTPKILAEDAETWLLELNRKAGVKKPYQKIVLRVCKTSYMPLAMDLYDSAGTLWKRMENKIKKIGSYWVAHHMRIEDKKRDSFTTLELEDIKLDQGLDDTIFSQRFLKRSV